MRKPFISKELLNNYYLKELFVLEIKFKREFEKTVLFKLLVKTVESLDKLLKKI